MSNIKPFGGQVLTSLLYLQLIVQCLLEVDTQKSIGFMKRHLIKIIKQYLY